MCILCNAVLTHSVHVVAVLMNASKKCLGALGAAALGLFTVTSTVSASPKHPAVFHPLQRTAAKEYLEGVQRYTAMHEEGAPVDGVSTVLSSTHQHHDKDDDADDAPHDVLEDFHLIGDDDADFSEWELTGSDPHPVPAPLSHLHCTALDDAAQDDWELYNCTDGSV